jgi:hypothetical protein
VNSCRGSDMGRPLLLGGEPLGPLLDPVQHLAFHDE